MKWIPASYRNLFFARELDMRVKLFNVLAITGVIICIIMTGVSIAGHMVASTIINIGAGLLSLFLLFYSARSGRYQLCYKLTIAVIFLILFPSLFFSGGGYQGGMSFFFVFSVVFTVYMLDGWSAWRISALELLVYSALCLIAYHRPDWITPFASEQAVVVDVIIGFVTVSISLGATMFVQVRMYQKQQAELETARKAAEEANLAKSAFLANMSHEIRTPIHMILGMNEIIHRESHSKRVRDYSDQIEETSKMLLSIVDNILDVSKIESGKMELIESPYDSADLVRSLELIGRTYCRKKDIQFHCNISEDLPAAMVGDMTHLRQIASNFLSNAAKYTESGTVTLTVSADPGNDENEVSLCISVEDTGIGIHQEEFPILFEAFSRADLAAHRHIAGTGLGLAIVRELTDLMKGTLALESQPGKGSTFTVRIPQKIHRDSLKSGNSSPMTFLAPRVRMLVVDDNEANRVIMKELLQPTAVQLETAFSGQECLQMVQENAYHIILMDYMMPGMDGLQTMQKLRQLPGFHTPVLALTADATLETEKKLLDGGFSCCMTKPIPWGRLREKLLEYMPPELVTRIEENPFDPILDQKFHSFSPLMLSYGITLDEGLKYFGNRPEDYLSFARIFLHHDADSRTKTEHFSAEGDCTQLRCMVHALKGKSRNLGMVRLSEVCAHTENLCSMGNLTEVQVLMPYILYLWQRGSDGLKRLLQELGKPAEAPQKAADPDRARSQLPGLLHELRRKPSLSCIASLQEQEDSPEGKQHLKQIASMVESFRFEEAETAFQNYLHSQKERDSQ